MQLLLTYIYSKFLPLTRDIILLASSRWRFFREVCLHRYYEHLPSIPQQLEEGCKLRKKIDRAVMKAMNMRVSLKRLYKGLAEEIRALKELMEERS